MAWKVNWQVKINGRDLSSRMAPLLLDIEVTDQEGTASDSCSLSFDDSSGQLKLPPKGSLVEAFLDGVMVFRGPSDAPRTTGTRGGGMILRVSAKGFDTRGPAKSQQLFHKDEATLEDFLGEAAENAGFSLKVDPQLGSIFRDYWLSDGESFLALGQRLAREMNATFKLRGQEAVFVPRGSSPLAGVQAIVGKGGNVISWDIQPFAGRGVYKNAKVRWFDRAKARFEEKDVEIEGLDGEASREVRTLAVDGDHADTIAKGRKSEAEQDAGSGTIQMDLVAHARAEAPLTLSGARPGVDGTYRIVSVKHSASRSGAATTQCQVKQPGGGAGKDDRKSASTGE
jgi:phage protein D